MRKYLVVIAVALAGFMAVTHSALAHPTLRHTYLHLHHQLGDRAGRNIVRHGARVHGHVRPASDHLIAKSVRTMRRMLAPPPAPAVAPVNAVQASVAVPAAPAATGGMPDCTWRPESGGSYTARNPSGAGGKYQIMPSTWRAYGGSGSASDPSPAAHAPPAEQEAVARRVLAGQGPGAWVNC